MSKSSQKFIARNRAPRVQIEYDVELYGAEKTIQLPFVMGVMADLSGKSEDPLPAVADRKFLEIDVDNFDDRMKSIKPRAAFAVPNTLTGEGNIAVDLTFERMDDFSPAAVARNVEPLNTLLEARTRLEHLRTYMDGKSEAEDLMTRLIHDPVALAALAGSAKETSQADAALDSMRNAATLASEDTGYDTDAVLAAMALQNPDQMNPPNPDENADGVLADLVQSSIGTEDANDGSVSEEGSTGKEPAAGQDASTSDTVRLPDNDGAGDTDVSEIALEGDALDAIEDDVDTGDELEALDSTIADPDVVADDLADTVGSDDTNELSEFEAPDTDEGADLIADHLDVLVQDVSDETEEETSLDDVAIEDDEPAAEEISPHGRLDLPKPEDRDAARPKFRIAILGDFTGRSSKGTVEIGTDLARRKPIKFDVDTLDDVIARFATKLVLPIGKDSAGVEVTLSDLDDLHPDTLYENVELFEALSNLRDRLVSGNSTQDIAQMQEWATEFGDTEPVSRARAAGVSVPANLKLSAFQSLIGDNTNDLCTPSPAEDLIGRIVGPYVQAAPDPDQPAMLAAVDEALSGAMRAILHHPDFQAVESTWRSLELLARRITTGAGLEIVLYDMSAEEWAADLASEEDLAKTGLFQMLAEEPRLDDAQGPLSAVFGLYTLEETPPHADLMARMAKISDWMNAPFLTAISENFLDTPKHERHPLVARSWDGLRAMPEASYVGLAAPQFLLRLPYGAKTEPVDPFDFEEFTLRDGLKGMLWANPVVLSAILLCETVNQKGKAMQLGDVMSVGDLPLHHITDQHGDQIALPCTRRLLNTRTMADVVARGYIPLLSIKGRTEVRQGSFQGLGPGMLAGPWGQSAGAGAGLGGVKSALDITREASDHPEDGVDFGPSRPGGAGEDYDEQFAQDEDEDSADDDDDLGFDGDDDDDLDGFDLSDGDDADDGPDDDLDALLAGFGDDDDGEEDNDEDMDPALAALMEDL